MKIAYITLVRLPTNKAHGIQIMETCFALSNLDIKIDLFIGRSQSGINKCIFEYYKIKEKFKIIKIFDLRPLLFFGSIGYYLRSLLFVLFSLPKMAINNYDVIYTRDELVAIVSSFLYEKTFYEIHDARKGIFQRLAIKRSRGVVAISHSLKRYCQDIAKNKENILIARDGVDLSSFDIPDKRGDCRKRLGLPSDRKIVVYTGQLYGWKGVDVLAAVASYFKDIDFVFVGGTDIQISDLKNKYSASNINMVGQKERSMMPYYLKAANILVLPNTAKEDISRLYTSPLKLFEYMSSGTPIVASDIPSLKEIVDEKNVSFFEADNVSSLKETIEKCLNNYEIAEYKATLALNEVRQYDWKERARRIASFISDVKLDSQ